MATPLLHINLPFPISTLQTVSLRLSPEMTVENVIQQCLFIQDPSRQIPAVHYLLVARPLNLCLVPQLLISDYFPQILKPHDEVHLELYPKRVRRVTVRHLQNEIHTECDLYQQARGFAKMASLLIREKSEDSIDETWNDWGIAFQKESLLPSEQILRCFDNSQTEPIFYLRRELHHQNKFVKNPLFSATVADALSRDNYSLPIPFFARTIFDIIESQMNVEGIYRKSGLQTNIDNMVMVIDAPANDHEALTAFLSRQRVHDLTGLIKLYLRQLSTSLIPAEMFPDFISAMSIKDNVLKFQTLKFLIYALPTDHFNFFLALSKHIEKITDNCEKNKMTVSNVATCLGPNLVPKSEGDAVKATVLAQNLSKTIFGNWKYFFGDETVVQRCSAKYQGKPAWVIRRNENDTLIDFNGKVSVIANEQLEFEDFEVPDFTDFVKLETGSRAIEFPQFLSPLSTKLKDVNLQLAETVERIALLNERLYQLLEPGTVKVEDMDELQSLVKTLWTV